MDNAAKVAEVAWAQAYFFKLDHKNGYLHIPLHPGSWKFLEHSGREFTML